MSRVPTLALCLLAAGCVRAARPPRQCPAISSLEALLDRGNLIVFGEIHGTSEIPAFVGDAVCAASRTRRVHVGLELPKGDAPLLAAFLSGRDDEGLRDSALWRGPLQYGVTSQAMFALLSGLRDLRRGGAPVEVFFFDDKESRGLEGRDQAMAEAISAQRRRAPGDLYLILVGNYHARTVAGAEWDKDKRWMAGFLAATEPGLVTLDVRNRGGTAWVCLEKTPGGPQTCGVQAIGKSGPPGPAAPRAIALEPLPALGYDGTYSVGVLSGSPPALSR